MSIVSEELVHGDLTGALADAQASGLHESGRFDAEAALTERLNWRRASMVAMGTCVALGLLETINAYVIRQIDGHPKDWLFNLREQVPWWLLWTVFMPAIMWLARTYRFDNPRWRMRKHRERATREDSTPRRPSRSGSTGDERRWSRWRRV